MKGLFQGVKEGNGEVIYKIAAGKNTSTLPA